MLSAEAVPTFFEKWFLQLCGKFTKEHPYFIEITFPNGYFINLMPVCKTPPFRESTSGGVFLSFLS